MEIQARYVLIGSFSLAVVAAFFLFILWFGRFEQTYDEYDVVFTEAVTGLGDGGVVRYKGISVGEIRDLRIDPDQEGRIIAVIRVQSDTPIYTDTIAQLQLQGVTGVAFIQLSDGDDPNAMPLPPTTSQRRAVIPAETGAFQRLFEEGGDIINHANEFVISLNALLNEENLENVGVTLQNIREVSDSIGEREEKIGMFLDDLSATSASLAKLSDNVAELAGDLSVASSSAARIMDEDVPGVLEEAETALRAASDLFQESHEVVEENRDSIRAFSEQGLGQTSLAVSEARELIRSLDRLVTAIERNPASFLQGADHPTYQGEE